MRGLIVAVAVVVAAAGAWQLRHTSVDVVPEFSPLSLVVKTEALGLSPAEVESLITVPLEADLLNGVPWMSSIQSESVAGLSSIEMYFVPGTDLMQARQMVDERLTQARALPNVSSPPTLLQPIASASQIMKIGLTSKTVSLIDMSVQARWEIVPRLLGVPGVANVSTWGQRDQQLQVLVDPAKLHAGGVSLEQVVKTAGEAVWASPLTYLESSTPGTGGFIDTPNQRLGVRHVQPISTPAEFAQVPVVGTDRPLGDVATLVKDHQPLIGDALFRSGPGLMLVVDKFPGFNTAEVTRNVEAVLAELRPAMAGIDVSTSLYRPASFIERATHNLGAALLIAGGLVLLVLVVTLGGWRAGLVAALSIVLSVLAAGLVLNLLRTNVDVMTVAGLLMASGIVASDAVVGADAMARGLRHAREQGGVPTRPSRAIADALAGVRGPLGYATLIVVVAVLPGLLIEGLSAGFFQPLIWTYLIAALTSAVVAVTVTPVLGFLLLSGGRPRAGEARSAAGPAGGAWLARVIGSPLPAYALVAAAIVGCALVWPLLDRSFLPNFKETDVNVTVQAAPGTSLPAMQAIVGDMIGAVGKIPGVRDVAGHVGRAALSHDIAGVDSAQLAVSLDPAADYDETLTAIEAAVKANPAARANVQAYLSGRMREALTGEDNGVRVRVYGQDPAILQAKAEEIRVLLGKVPGVSDPRVEAQTQSPSLEIEVDLNRAAQHGLKPGDIRRATSALVSGITVGALYEEQKIFDVVVWGQPQTRATIDDIRNLLIDSEGGDQVRLADVADVRTSPSMNVIRRQGVSRRLDIYAEVGGRALAEVTRDVEGQIAGMSFPFEYHARVVGESVERQAAQASVLSYVVAAGVIVLLLLQAATRSWRLAVAAILGMSLVLVGGLAALWLAREPFSLASAVGLVAVWGVAVRDLLLLAARLRAWERRDADVPRGVAVARGLGERVRPVVATAAVVAALCLTSLFFEDSAGMELVFPAAVTMLGGTLAGAVMTLLVFPALYLRFAPAGAAAGAWEEEHELDDRLPGPPRGGIPAQA